MAGAALLAVTATGCSGGSDTTSLRADPPTVPSVAAAHAARQLAQPGFTPTAVDPPHHPARTGPGAADPQQVAATFILDGLAAEGLLATSLDTEVAARTGRQATVVVTVAHSPGHGHPTQSRYRLELTDTPDGWMVTGHRDPA
ncbi:MAG: hypothetical protein EA340_00515 [Nitriliruptor sp.]|nr:MAG: hypothetical protein EA340_00515 [Nitriliruptor sp.]